MLPWITLDETRSADDTVLTLVRRGTEWEVRAVYDLILLDVDNGPAALIQGENAGLYDATGIVACHAALKEGGALAVWAAGPDDRYLRRLQRSGFDASAVRVAPRPGAGGRKHVVFVAVKAVNRGGL